MGVCMIYICAIMYDTHARTHTHTHTVLCQDYCHLPSHWNADKTLSDWLKENNVPGMYGIDTRALTKKLRVHGSMKGKIVMDEDVPLIDPNLVNQVCLGSWSGFRDQGGGFEV